MTTRTDAETKLLREEAGRLGRMNWKRTEMSRGLGVPLHTLARWAFEDGWRQKDLAAEGEAERIAAISEQIAQRRAHSVQWEASQLEAVQLEASQLAAARLACGRSAGPVELQLEYKSAGPEDSSERPVPAGGHGEDGQREPLPKFLTRGGDPDEQVRWAAPEQRVKTPPWAPGNATEEPEFASLWLAEDLMRQGLLSEAEKALRFTRNWLAVSRQVFDEHDRQEAAHREYEERREKEHAKEKARCKALGLPDPDEEFAAMARRVEQAWQDARNNKTATPQHHEKSGE